MVGGIWAFPTEEMKELMGDFLHKTRWLQWSTVAFLGAATIWLWVLTVATIYNIVG